MNIDLTNKMDEKLNFPENTHNNVASDNSDGLRFGYEECSSYPQNQPRSQRFYCVIFT